MTRRYTFGLFVPLSIALILGVTLSCGSGDSPNEPEISLPTTVTITPESANLDEIGGTVQLAAEVLDQNGLEMTDAFVWWITEEADVATVDGTGLVTANGMGVVSIMAGAGNARDTAEVSIAIAPPLITPVTLTSGVVGHEYSQSLTATGGDGGYAWSISGGNLPPGLALDSGGTISGTPTISGMSTFTVQVTSRGESDTKEMSLEVLNPWLYVKTTALMSEVVGGHYSQSLEATGGDSNYAWSITAGTLPTGLTLSAAGTISGTPTAVGNSTFTVEVASGGRTATRALFITIVSGDLGLSLDADQFELIPAGTFQMGSNGGGYDERPVHAVNITQPFYLQKTEVTQSQWRAVMGTNPSYYSSCGETCPVEMVSWNHTQAFLNALNAAEPGMNYRLPTEAEWEYAARAGTTGDYGGTGNLDEMGWYSGNSGGRTHPVGRKQANAWDLYDMHGNVDEWVNDWYSSAYYSLSPTDDPTGPASGSYRVTRGGTWWWSEWSARSFDRSRGWPHSPSSSRGFRLVRNPS